MIRRPPRSTLDRSSAASDVYKRQQKTNGIAGFFESENDAFLLVRLDLRKDVNRARTGPQCLVAQQIDLLASQHLRLVAQHFSGHTSSHVHVIACHDLK